VTVIDHPHAQERAWLEGEAQTVAVMGTLNAAAAQLVTTIRMLLDTDGWHGWGIQSPEHWVMWKAGISPDRASKLVHIARRLDELPACWALFEQGRITEDAMARVARRVPADMDADVAQKVPILTIRQLDRALAACPPIPDEDPRPKIEPERHVRMCPNREGWLNGSFSLPPDEGAVLQAGLTAARDAEFRDRQGLEPDADLEGTRESDRCSEVSWADALVRMASEGADALDSSLLRTGQRGERNKVVLHRDMAADGLGPAQLHLGPTLPEGIARYMECDADMIVALYHEGRLLGFTPTARTVNRATHRAIERRDQGCAHPLCNQKRWLHVHHIEFWEDGGLTVSENLICLCPKHHRALHAGDFRIEGNPDLGTVRFITARGSPIEPPGSGPPRLPDPRQPSPFTSPLGERMSPLWFAWN
jgi:hypothetical protein